MPDDETKVIPPRNVAARTPHPRAIPAMNPGVKFKTASTTPAGAEDRRAERRSRAEYSSPSMNSSRISPISAPVWTNAWVVTRGRIPPLPKARPAPRYSGIAGIPIRPATRARTASPITTAPSSSSLRVSGK